MGILVPEAILPSSNIAVSNVYMSFSGEAIETIKNPYTSEYYLSSKYRVFSNPTKQPCSNIIEPLMVPYSNLDQGVFTVLYTALKELYPGSEDSLVNYALPAPDPEPTSNVISE
jgi:hypothetical protein